MKDDVAALHGRRERRWITQVADDRFHIKPLQHPGWAGGSVEGTHAPACREACPNHVVADTACGAQNDSFYHGRLLPAGECDWERRVLVQANIELLRF
jgi:hypothetical protein